MYIYIYETLPMAATASISLLYLSHNKSIPLRKSPPTIFKPKLSRFTINPHPQFKLTYQNPHFHSLLAQFRAYPIGSNDSIEKEIEDFEKLSSKQDHPVKFTLWVLFWASLSIAWFATSGDANSATDSIRASGFGVKIANKLRGLGWADEAVVFALATLPVIELRGAIPVGYWLQLKPIALTVLSVLGNMVVVPFIILYLKPLATFLAGKNRHASHMLNLLLKKAKEKAGPVEEFQWLGLMLFVAVPFPGTGAWTGAIIASVLDMPFWHAMSANFFGVVLAGLLVNLLVNLGLKYAIITGVVLFFVSTFMWNVLRSVKKCLS